MKNIEIAFAYYTALQEKNLEGMSKYLHPNVQMKNPLAQLEGKEAVLEAANKLIPLISTLTIRGKFGAENQTVIVFDLELHPPIGNVPSASLMSFQDNLIATIELFFDARPFEKR